jgi:hypothetical protein
MPEAGSEANHRLMILVRYELMIGLSLDAVRPKIEGLP